MYRTFTYDTDFVYAMAFCNCISTEMAKLNISAADHQKGGKKECQLLLNGSDEGEKRLYWFNIS